MKGGFTIGIMVGYLYLGPVQSRYPVGQAMQSDPLAKFRGIRMPRSISAMIVPHVPKIGAQHLGHANAVARISFEGT